MSKKNEMFVPADEQPEDFADSELDRTALGREMKIGLAVLLVLLIVLGTVLVGKMNRSGRDIAADPGKASAGDAKSGHDADDGPALTSPGQPTVMTAGADSRVEPTSGTVASWAVADDGVPATGVIAATPPSFMPKAVAAEPAPHYAGYGQAEATSDSPATWQSSRSNATGSQETTTTTDPFLRQKPPTGGATSDPVVGNEWSVGAAPAITQADGIHGADQAEPSSGAAPALNPLTAQPGVAEPPALAPLSSTTPVSGPMSSTTPVSAPGDAAGLGPHESPATPGPLPGYGGYSRSTYRESEQSGVPAPMATSGQPSTRLESRPVVQSNNGTYTIQPGDNYWLISEKLYGTGGYFRALAEHNREKFPQENRLAVGETISAPSAEELTAHYAGLCPKPAHRDAARQRARIQNTSTRLGGGRVYVVREGDTLFDVAKFELGKASRWVEVYELNRDILGQQFDYLTPGMQLVLPDDQPGGTLTQRPEQLYQR